MRWERSNNRSTLASYSTTRGPITAAERYALFRSSCEEIWPRLPLRPSWRNGTGSGAARISTRFIRPFSAAPSPSLFVAPSVNVTPTLLVAHSLFLYIDAFVASHFQKSGGINWFSASRHHQPVCLIFYSVNHLLSGLLRPAGFPGTMHQV